MAEGTSNGRVTAREVYELVESKFTPLETRVRRVEQGVIALLVLSGGQVAAAVNGTSVPAVIEGLFT